MILARGSATAGGRLSWRLARALLLAFLVIGAASAARGQDDASLYQATVNVDATAANAPAARHLARLEGQRKALQKLVDRLSGSPDTKLAKLPDGTITDMVESFEVANEHMSAVRYLAEYTFQFYPAKVQQLLQSYGIAEGAPPGTGIAAPPGNYPETGPAPDAGAGYPPAPVGRAAGGGRTIVLPIYSDGGNAVLWNDPNPWRAAWARRPAAPGGSSVPLGDAGDVAAIDGQRAESGDPAALAAIAQRERAGFVVVALARAWRSGSRLAGLDVSIKDYRAGGLVGSDSKTFTAKSGEMPAALFDRAADGVAEMIEKQSRGSAMAARGPGSVPAVASPPGAAAPFAAGSSFPVAPPSGSSHRLDAVVPINSLGDWLDVRQRLSAVAGIKQVALLSLSRHQAEIEIDYIGSPDQLRSSLAGAKLTLAGGDPQWRLEPAGAQPRTGAPTFGR